MQELREARDGQARVASRSPRRTSCARACASSACPTRRSSSCSGRPATSPIARSSRRSTSCGGRTCCRTSSCSSRSAGASTTTTRSGPRSGRRSSSTAGSCRSTRRPGGRSASASATTASTSPTRRASTRWRPRLDELDEERGTRGNRLFYLATQPSQFAEIVAQLGRVGLDHERHDGGWRRVVIEKPFGHDLDSAKRLNREVGKVFRESQVYRIDHYLGKETVRNLLVFRFGNGIFEPLWNRRYVDHVQITVAESIGIENRGAFYEETGAVARRPPEPPAPARQPGRDGAAGDVRGRRPARREGQGAARHRHAPGRSRRPRSCAASTARAGSPASPVPGYRQEPEVDPESETETFVAARLTIDDWRWSGVPFYVRTGKRLPEARDRDRHPVPRGPAPPVPGRRRRPRPEPAGDPDPARRGDHAALRGQGARARPGHPVGDDGLHLRLGVQRRLAGRLRDAHPRRAAGRRVAVHPRRRGRGGVGHRRPAHRRLGRRAARPTSRTTTPARGARPRPTSCSRARAGAGGGSERRRDDRAAAPTLALNEPVLRWSARAHSIAEIETELARIWARPGPDRRRSTASRAATSRRGRA